MAQEYLVDPAVTSYVRKNSLRDTELLSRLRKETASHPRAEMQVSAEQGQMLGILVKAIGARKTLEVGVFTGYSSLSVALSLPPEGRIVACDVSEEFTSLAKPYWAEAGVSNKIDLRIAPASETLDALIANGESGTFDFAFIDADKPGYARYYEQCLQLVRPGGLIALDNMLQHGRVLTEEKDENAAAIHALNEFIHQDSRVDSILLPLADGITLAVRK